MAACRGSFHEKLNGRILERFHRGYTGIFRRTIECVEEVDMFAFNPEGFTTRCQDVRLRRFTDDPFGQCGCRVDHMLAIVEDEKDLPVANKGRKALQRIFCLRHKPDCRCDGRRQRLDIGQCGQIDEENRSVEPFQEARGQRRWRRWFFRCAAWLPTMLTNRYVINCADNMRMVSWRLIIRVSLGGQPFWSGSATVTSLGEEECGSGSCYRARQSSSLGWGQSRCNDCPRARPQRIPEIGNVDAEIRLLHRHIGPNAGDQFLLSDDLSGPVNQRDQRVERAAP